MKLYSWKDIERKLLLSSEKWNKVWSQVECYPEEIIISKNTTPGQGDSSIQLLSQLFNGNFIQEKMSVKLDIGDEMLPVIIEESNETYQKPHRLPLFREMLYASSSYPENNLPELSCPVLAFHSYKGGVGRTLSVIAFAKAWAEIFKNTEKERLLIIDSDIEAPGLTWLQEEKLEDNFSYLDLLNMIQDSKDLDGIVETVSSKLLSSTISFETTTKTVEHFFLPTYRYQEQLLDMYASPESIVNRKNKEYVLSEVLSKIAERIKASAVIVDLRAGLSEFSATILLDQRVKKYLVTSTSLQSVNGTQIVLNYLTKGLRINEKTLLPEVLISMVPDNFPEEDRNKIYSSLHIQYEMEQNSYDSTDNYFIDSVITEFPFASELIHLTTLQQILQNLEGRGMYSAIKQIVEQNYNLAASKTENHVEETKRDAILNKITKMANSQLTAESGCNFDILITEPIKYLVKQYSDRVPQTVIMGAKGSGKTFLFKKMTEAKTWGDFVEKFIPQLKNRGIGSFIPAFASKNATSMTEILKPCIRSSNETISKCNISDAVYVENSRKLEKSLQGTVDWYQFWEQQLSNSFNPECNTFDDISNILKENNQSIVFLIDGLEETLKNVSDNEKETAAVCSLCQDVVNILTAKYPNIGIVVFLRKDMAHDAISVNFEQFAQRYQRAELQWSSSEALRLAVWLVSQADDSFYRESVEIAVASKEIIDVYLEKLWGLKLGRADSNEAYSSRWILAALSDFNRQLQARDIIRFLKYAATQDCKKPPTYCDRILMPADIKNAVSMCSKEKISEIRQEYAALRPIFEKLDTISPEQKILPLDPHIAKLTSEEEKLMTQEGYLIKDNGKYYIPEIVRHALNFKYERGARPKVLSLLLKH